MIVAHLIASFQAMDDDFATRAAYSRSGLEVSHVILWVFSFVLDLS